MGFLISWGWFFSCLLAIYDLALRHRNALTKKSRTQRRWYAIFEVLEKKKNWRPLRWPPLADDLDTWGWQGDSAMGKHVCWLGQAFRQLNALIIIIIIIIIMLLLLIIIITILKGAFISIFPNKFKAPQGWSFETYCQWALLNVRIITLLFTFTIQEYIYHSVMTFVVDLTERTNYLSTLL